MINKTVREKVLAVLIKIPKGRVTTYKRIASTVNSCPRTVATILRQNKDYGFPCYKVVKSNGKIGGYNKGIKEKILLLGEDGIKVKNGKIKDFEKILF